VTSVEGYARPATRWRLGVGAAVVIVLLALAVTVGIGVVKGSAAPTESVLLDEDRGADEAAELYVHVYGAVSEPGLYVLREGARVVDAVGAAGGMLEGADEAAVNLARQVGDGEQLYVPTLGESAVAGAPSAAGREAGDGRINLNTATEAEFDTLPRIGPAMARRIIEWRDANGRFTSVEDLLAVPGIGDKMLESLRALVTL